MEHTYKANELKVKTLETEYVGLAGLIPILKFEVTLPNGDTRTDTVDSREDKSLFDYLCGATNIAERYYGVIA